MIYQILLDKSEKRILFSSSSMWKNGKYSSHNRGYDKYPMQYLSFTSDLAFLHIRSLIESPEYVVTLSSDVQKQYDEFWKNKFITK